MIRGRLLCFIALSTLIGREATPVNHADDVPRLVGITAVVGGPVTYIVAPKNSPDRIQWVSSSPLIESALLPVFFSGTPVAVDLVPGSSVIQRVLPYSIQNQNPSSSDGMYSISRIATQRTPEGKDEHMEVFLVKGKDPEKAYNISDPLLQQLAVAAFSHYSGRGPIERGINVEFAGDLIVSISAGEYHH